MSTQRALVRDRTTLGPANGLPARRRSRLTLLRPVPSAPVELGVIVNPGAGGRRAADPTRRQALLAGAVGPDGLVLATRSVDEIKPALRELFRRGAKAWVVDGGDGTLHWVLRSAREVLAEPEMVARQASVPMVLPTGAGTVNVVAGHAGIDGRRALLAVDRLRRALAAGRPLATTEVDTMHVRGWRRIGGARVPFETVGFAAAVGGVGQRFFAELYRYPVRGPQHIAAILAKSAMSWVANRTPVLGRFAGAELRGLERAIFRPTEAVVEVDGQRFEATAMTGINIASLPVNLGGVLRVFAGAAEPGWLHALYGAAPPPELLLNIPRGVLGLPVKSDAGVDAPCRTMTVRAAGSELLAPVIDGDYYHDVEEISFEVGEPLRIPRLR